MLSLKSVALVLLAVPAIFGQHNIATTRTLIARQQQANARASQIFGQGQGLKQSLQAPISSISSFTRNTGRQSPSDPRASFNIADALNKCRGSVGSVGHLPPPKPQPSGTPGNPGSPGNCDDVTGVIADVLKTISATLVEIQAILGQCSNPGAILSAIADLDEELALLLESIADQLKDCFTSGLPPKCRGHVQTTGSCGLPKCGRFLGF